LHSLITGNASNVTAKTIKEIVPIDAATAPNFIIRDIFTEKSDSKFRIPSFKL
jgi:hypothetical protein